MGKQNGSVLTVAILCTAIVTLFSAGLFALTLNNSAITNRLHNSMKAFFLAEAGASHMLAVLKENYANKDDSSKYPSVSLAGGSYSVTITQPSKRVIVQSIGTMKKIKRRVIIEVIWNGGEAFNYGIFSNGNLTFAGLSKLDYNERTNSNLTVSGNAQLKKDAYASGTITILNQGKILGKQYPGVAKIPYPTFDFNYYYNLASNGGLLYTGNQTFNNKTLAPGNGVMYVNGNVTFTGTSKLTGVLVATGSITLQNTFTQTQVSTYPALMSRDSNITTSGTMTTDGLIYTATGNIDISGTGAITGQIMSFGTINYNTSASKKMKEENQTPPGLTGDSSPIKQLTYHE